MLAGALLLAAVWAFLLRDLPAGYFAPRPANLWRVFDPGSFGPSVFGTAAAVVLVFLLVFGLLGGWILAGRMLAPLNRITAAARTAANGSLSHRIRLPGRGDEFRELADRRSFTRERVDLSLLAEEATETLVPLAEKHGVTIETSGDIGLTVGSPALLLQLTANLLHNAIVHNLPEHGVVRVDTVVGPGSVTLIVENTGDELTPQLVSTLTEPFQRGTQRARTDQAGVGLGLAIVESIARAHDGTLTLAARPAGGLRATVQLPAASPPRIGSAR